MSPNGEKGKIRSFAHCDVTQGHHCSGSEELHKDHSQVSPFYLWCWELISELLRTYEADCSPWSHILSPGGYRLSHLGVVYV